MCAKLLLATTVLRSVGGSYVVPMGCCHALSTKPSSSDGLSKWRQRLAQMTTSDDGEGAGSSNQAADFEVDAIVESLALIAQEHGTIRLSAQALMLRLDQLQARAAALHTPGAVKNALPSMTVPQLKELLKARGLPVSGKKVDLVERLQTSLSAAAAVVPPSTAKKSTDAVPGGARGEWVERELSALSRTLPLETPYLASELSKVQHAGAKGPQSGIFTDGGCNPNPGPGGWGVVAVDDGRILWRARGSSGGELTTNNRMEMSALIAALSRVPKGPPPSAQSTVYSDSKLCVQTLNSWARGWERNGWTRKGGEKVMNLDLVREAYALKQARPGVKIEWIKGHSGATWNEYADRLASAWDYDK